MNPSTSYFDAPACSSQTGGSNQTPIWNFFKKHERLENSSCNICNQVLQTPGSTTSTLIRHLSTKHPKHYEKYKVEKNKVNDEKSSQKAKKAKTDKFQTILQDVFKSTLPSVSTRATTITQKIGEMIALDFQPYSIVEDQGFRSLLSVLEPKYTPPTRKQLSSKVIPEIYNTVRDKTLTKLSEEIKTTTLICLTIDLWTSKAQESYMSLTIHYVPNTFTLCNHTLECVYFPGEHTGKAIYEKVKSVCSTWDIDIEITSFQKVYIVTDNARNIAAAFNGKLVKHLTCVAHTLQLVINDAIKESNMEPVLKKCRVLVGHYKHSTVALQRLQACQERLKLPKHKLKQMVETRWNSVYLMLERLLEQKDAICIDYPQCGKDEITVRDWQVIETYVDSLKPFYQATTELSRESVPTLSMVLPIVFGIEFKLRENLVTSSKCDKSFTKSLLNSLKARFHALQEDSAYLLAMILDPRFKGVILEDHELARAQILLQKETELLKKDREEVTDVLEEPKAQDNFEEPQTGVVWEALRQRMSQKKKQLPKQFEDTIKKEISEYLDEPIIAPNDDTMLWWRKNSHRYSNLAPVAQMFLAISATSVSSERLFSKAGQIVTNRRQSLGPRSVEMLTFLHDNLKTSAKK